MRIVIETKVAISELRLGNYVFDELAKKTKVFSLSIDEDGNGIINGSPADVFYPIPLRLTELNFFKLKRYKRDGVKYKVPNKMKGNLKKVDNSDYYKYGYGNILVVLKSVHHFQNVFFDINGFDLDTRDFMEWK